MTTRASGVDGDGGVTHPRVLDDKEDKIHTFRKRRLSLPLHHLSNDPAAAAKQQQEAASGITDTQKLDHDAAVASPPPDDEGDKAHTFRKRRLSLTAKAVHTADVPSAETSPVARNNRRRSSIESCAESSVGSNSAELKFVSRTVHSGEMIRAGVPPPSPANDPSNILYQQKTTTPPPPPPPFLAGDNGRQQHQPKWKRRRTVKDDSELHKLPFSRDVVGTYSCHGVEPVYGSEYDETEDQQDDVDEQQWLSPTTQLGDNNNNNNNDAIPVPTDTKGNSTSNNKDENNSSKKVSPQNPDKQLDGAQANTPELKEKSKDSPKSAVVTGNREEEEEESPPVTVAKINQDRGGVAFPYGNCPKTALFCVYDGHGQGGELVSQFALYEVQRRLEKHPAFPNDLKTAFKETFLSVDNALKDEPLIEPLFAGTTACVALLQNTILTVANAGDSRAVIARKLSNGKHIALQLTQDQNPDVPSEMERILNSGGYVSLPPAPGLSARVWLDPMCTQIGLAMARSIGDHAVGAVGVIAEPEVTTHEITRDDEFLILASDGVWEFIDSLTAIQIVASNLNKGATKACQALIEAAAAKWHEEEGAYRDDITAIVVKLQDLWNGAFDLKTRSDSVATDASAGS